MTGHSPDGSASPAPESAPSSPSPSSPSPGRPREGPGSRIGPYKLLQLIGEGGFGAVFMAEQERQALALMDHPNIAKVFDAGATETGRPFFVMELVKGRSIVEYCDAEALSIAQRLELFAQVCNAVQHAYSKGIIHRDIKPSNVLAGRRTADHSPRSSTSVAPRRP